MPIATFYWPKKSVMLCLVLALSTGCARQADSILFSGQPKPAQQLPFDRTPSRKGVPATAGVTPPEVPVGTSIVIRLQSPLSSASAHSGDAFEAVLDQPITARNHSFAATGTVVRGSVLAAKAADPIEAGYLRLTIFSILVDGRPLQVHTSSIFAKGSVRLAPEGMIGDRPWFISTSLSAPVRAGIQANALFSTARRLTFRLVKPLSLAD